MRLIQSATREFGLTVASVHIGFDVLDGTRQREVPSLVRRDLELAAELGARFVIIHKAIFADPDRLIVDEKGKMFPGFTVDRDIKEWPPMRDRIRDHLTEYAEAARSLGVCIAFETDWKNSGLLLDFVSDVDERSCGICFDTGHAQVDSGAVALAEKLGTRVVCTHIHDNNGSEDQHLPPFQGVIDWPGVVRALWEAGYRGRFTFETMQGSLADVADMRERFNEMWPGNTGENQS